MNRMSALGLLLLLLLIAGVSASASEEAIPADRNFNHFSTAGHEKSKGLNMVIAYPNSWAAKEGEHPNIVQVFISDGGKGLESAMIITKNLPVPAGGTLSERELAELFDPGAMKDMIPPGATFIDARPTKIEGLKAGILEYSMELERAGATIALQTIQYMFVFSNVFVSVQFAVANGAPRDPRILNRQMAHAKPMFFRLANTIVLTDKWK